jgi:hypothetical protein
LHRLVFEAFRDFLQLDQSFVLELVESVSHGSYPRGLITFHSFCPKSFCLLRKSFQATCHAGGILFCTSTILDTEQDPYGMTR